MKTKKTLLAVAILGMIALTGSQAQSITGTGADPNAGTFKDGKLSIPQRIQLANSVLTSGTDQQTVAAAASYMLMARPVVHLVNAFPAFADSVLADPTLGGLLVDANPISGLAYGAIVFKTDTTIGLNAKLAYLKPLLDSPLLNPAYATAAKSKYTSVSIQKAQEQYQAGDFNGAIATLMPVAGWSPSCVPWIFKAKLALRSPDVLSWAKLLYVVQPFGGTQAGIDAVSSAFRSLDTGIVRANAFIQFQKDGLGTNPLAEVPFPTGVTYIGNNATSAALNFGLAGDNISALKTAANAFAAAPSGTALNGATAFVAQWLRNTDGNLVRANAFVSAQSAGTAYPIAELSK